MATEETKRILEATMETEARTKAIQRETEALKQKAEATRREIEALKAPHLPTRFLDYIGGVEKYVYTAVTIHNFFPRHLERGLQSMGGKHYPLRFLPWTDFAATHEATFAALTTTFADQRLFQSEFWLECIGKEIHTGFAEEDLHPFIRATVEKPVMAVVNKYLEMTAHPTIAKVELRSHAYGLQAGSGTASSHNMPQRWLFSTRQDGRLGNVLVGNFMAAGTNLLSREQTQPIMSALPEVDLYPRITQEAIPTRRAFHDVYVAKVISQAYHYMIMAGLGIGYVVSGDGLIFLRVPEDDPDTLYYFWSVFPLDLTTRAPIETATAHMITLFICAIQSSIRSSRWIDACKHQVNKWPTTRSWTPVVKTVVPILPAKSTHGEDTQGQTEAPRPASPCIVEPPTLPYCTQKCLRGLCLGLPLNDSCPNVALHRAARVKTVKGTENAEETAETNAEEEAKYNHNSSDSHPLTPNQIRSHIIAQLAANMDKDAECLDKYGCFGRNGALFKLAVTGYGYTFAGKAVQSVHKYVIEREAATYATLECFQGVLIPVCMGIIDLERPIPLHSLAQVSHMLLLSYAGPDLSAKKRLPANIDFAVERERTLNELKVMGLWDEGLRDANLVWNAEVGRVMRIDFGRSVLHDVRVFHKEKLADVVKAAPAELNVPLAESASIPSSSVATKRDLNTTNDLPDGDDQVQKRARAA